MNIVILFLLIAVFLIVTSAVIFYLTKFLFPLLAKKGFGNGDPLLSDSEHGFTSGNPQFHFARTGRKAVVHCNSNRSFEAKRFDYKGQKDCNLFVSLYDGEYECAWGCIGFGSCAKRCPRNAIKIVNDTAVVTSVCNGCGLCVESCPQKLIKLVSANTRKCKVCSLPEGDVCKCSESNKTVELKEEDTQNLRFWKFIYKLLKK